MAVYDKICTFNTCIPVCQCFMFINLKFSKRENIRSKKKLILFCMYQIVLVNFRIEEIHFSKTFEFYCDQESWPTLQIKPCFNIIKKKKSWKSYQDLSVILIHLSLLRKFHNLFTKSALSICIFHHVSTYRFALKDSANNCRIWTSLSRVRLSFLTTFLWKITSFTM